MTLKDEILIRCIVFDFDGTLIDSNRLKHDAFFKLFPSDNFHKRIITSVLTEFIEDSRYIILRKILYKVKAETGTTLEVERRIEELAKKYDAIVVSGAKHCKEKPGAKSVLECLSAKYRLYLSSTTPDKTLTNIVKYRKWDRYFYDVFGYPNDKVSTLLEIMRKELIAPNEILVVGDGESDRTSAKKTGCRFFPIHEESVLEEVITEAKIKLR